MSTVELVKVNLMILEGKPVCKETRVPMRNMFDYLKSAYSLVVSLARWLDT